MGNPTDIVVGGEIPASLDREALLPRFLAANLGALAFAAAASLLALNWIGSLAGILTLPGAAIVVIFIAIVPGYLNMFMLLSLLLFRQKPLSMDIELPPLSILVAAYNEEANLPETLRGIESQDYPADIEVIIVDDGSTDGTLNYLRSVQRPGLQVISIPHQGKAAALNAGLEAVSHRVLITIDADTFLYRQALRRIVARLLEKPEHAAVAGSVLVKNSRESLLTRLQEWDYFLAINAVKRQQGMYRGTLVAQGAFSAFRTGVVRAARGWPDRIGEDIVLTWALLREGYLVAHEPTAIGFTRAPVTLRSFIRQRQRWARGMIEALKSHIDIIWRRRDFASYFVALDLLFPPLDLFITAALIPGMVLACFGHFYLAGAMTLLVLPLAGLIVLTMLRFQRVVFNFLGLRIRRNILGFIAYFFVYQLLVSPVCVAGYCKELLNYRRKW
ncbi:MAG: glycosyltransferase family 2 protein [Gaiellales bacterium]|nr:MAG: glycosyltransferase family 2 protein [Gaiellales bacterium]